MELVCWLDDIKKGDTRSSAARAPTWASWGRNPTHGHHQHQEDGR